MRVIFFGLGSIGLRHAAMLKGNRKFDLYAFRTHKGQIQDKTDIQELNSWKAIEKVKPQVAFIANPTNLHIDTALKCAKRGMHLFIEKPLGDRLDQLTQLIRIVSQKKLTTYVAYVLRFHPVINEIRSYMAENKNRFLHMRVQTTSYLHRWRPKVNTRKSYSAHRKMGGGVILDLSHEIDYVQYLLGGINNMKGQFSKRSDLTVDSEDYADILVEAKHGPANIHINFCSQTTQRVIQLDFKDKSVMADLINNTFLEFRDSKLVNARILKGSIKDCFQAQMKYFFDNIGNPRIMNNIVEAAPLLKKIVAFRNSKNAQ